MADIIKLDGTRQLDFDREMVEQAYDRWAPVYDLVFGGVFSKGRKAAIQATNKIGGRVLEVGVGTGISLPQYASHLRIFGTDISEAMLQKAKKRVDELGLKNVEGLSVMDAEKLEFPDDSFDVVMAQYVVTAVPNPEAALDEFARVLRPDGELIILTRVSADAGMRRFIEQRLQPVVHPLGFRTAEFAWSRYAPWLAGAGGIAPWGARAASNGRSAAWCRRSATSPWCVFVKSTSPRPRNAWPMTPASSRRCKLSHVNMMMSHAGHRISVNVKQTRIWG